MPRPTTLRRVGRRLSGVRGFRPLGRSACKTDAAVIGLDELEALRLADVEGLYQEAAAALMGISRQTYARLLGKARHAVASSLVGGKVLLVGDGPVICESRGPAGCPVHGGPRREGRTCHCPCGGQCGKGRQRAGTACPCGRRGGHGIPKTKP